MKHWLVLGWFFTGCWWMPSAYAETSDAVRSVEYSQEFTIEPSLKMQKGGLAKATILLLEHFQPNGWVLIGVDSKRSDTSLPDIRTYHNFQGQEQRLIRELQAVIRDLERAIP